MSNLNRIIERIALVFALAVIGAMVGIGLAYLEAQGTFEQWEALGKPPGRVTQMYPTGDGNTWVETDAGQRFVDINQTGCAANCWVATQDPPPVVQYATSLDQCGPLPAYDSALLSQAVCENVTLATILTVVVVRPDGQVYRWSQAKGESDGLLFLASPFVGAGVGPELGWRWA